MCNVNNTGGDIMKVTRIITASAGAAALAATALGATAATLHRHPAHAW